MDTAQLETILSTDKITRLQFRGVFPSDRLPHRLTHYPSAFVANVDPSSQPGSHWIAFYFDGKQQGEFWDSYGQPPEIYSSDIVDFLNNNSKRWTKNNRMLQSLDSNVCGQFCIYYLVHRCRGFSMNSIVSRFDKKNTRLNDAIVFEFVHRHYLYSSQSKSLVNTQMSKSRH